MSLNALPLRIVQSMDEIMAFKQEREFAVYDGGAEVSYTPFPAQALNNSNIQVTFNPPDEKTVVDPHINVDVQYTLKFTGVGAGGGPLLVPGVFDGPRSYPLSNTTSTVDIKVNGTSFNTNLNEYWSILNRTGMYARDFNQDYSTTFSALDLSQEYADLAGATRNPLNDYASSPPFYQSRNADVSTTDPNAGVYIPVNTNTNATVIMNCNEPVFLSPFYPSRSGFAGIKTMTGTWTFSDLRRVWSHGTGTGSGTITSFSVDITFFQVNFRYITPKDLSIIPKQLCWPYHEFLIVATTLGSPTPANTVGVTAQLTAINLEAHPQRLVFCLRERDTDLLTGPVNYQLTDSYARINSISINYGNNQGKLSSATPEDLYQMYVRNSNGNMSWTEWYSKVGSVCVVDVGKDIGLGSLDAPSKLSNPLLSATINFTNLKSRSCWYTFFCFVIYEGTACNNFGSFTKSIAVLNSQDVLKSQEPGTPTIVAHEPTNVYGGNFFSTLKDAFMKGKDFVKKHHLLSKGLSLIPNPYAKAASVAAKSLGYGVRAGAVVTMPRYYQDLEQLPMKGGKRRKTKKASRRSLKRRGGSLNDDSNQDCKQDSNSDDNSNSDQDQDQIFDQE